MNYDIFSKRKRYVLNIFDVEFDTRETRDGGEGLFRHEKGRGTW